MAKAFEGVRARESLFIEIERTKQILVCDILLLVCLYISLNDVVIEQRIFFLFSFVYFYGGGGAMISDFGLFGR